MAKAKSSPAETPGTATQTDVVPAPHQRMSLTEADPTAGRKKAAIAGSCPKGAAHTATRVYRTEGRTRYCKCNDCGHTWTVAGGYADQGREYLDQLAQGLINLPRQNDADGNPVVVLTDAEAKSIVTALREIVSGR